MQCSSFRFFFFLKREKNVLGKQSSTKIYMEKGEIVLVDNRATVLGRRTVADSWILMIDSLIFEIDWFRSLLLWD